MMTTQTVTANIINALEDLPLEQQQEVLDFIHSLETYPKGVSGKSLLRFAGTISNEDLTLMQEAIEEGCEQINLNEW